MKHCAICGKMKKLVFFSFVRHLEIDQVLTHDHHDVVMKAHLIGYPLIPIWLESAEKQTFGRQETKTLINHFWSKHVK